jgi:hypothetical protein
MKTKNIFTVLSLLSILFGLLSSCKKDLENHATVNYSPNINSTNNDTQHTFVGLMEVLEDKTASISTIVTNSGYSTIYNLSVSVKSGDILRIRGQVEMTNDKPPYPGGGSITVRGNIRILVNGSVKGSQASQNDVADPYSPYAHHMHHMPLWTDALYTVPQNGTANVEVQYSTTKSSSSPIVKIEPYGSPTPAGHLIIEHYRLFSSRQSAKDSLALGLDTILSDNSKNATSFFNATTVYSIQCSVDNGDIMRLFSQSTSGYINKKALHGVKILRNRSLISPNATENNISRIPYLPIWLDAIDKPTSSATNNYSVELHSDPEYDSASITDAGYFYCLKFKRPGNNQNSRQLSNALIINGPTSNYSLLANSGWHNIITYNGQAHQGDILKITGFAQYYIPNTYQYGINCQFRIKVAGSVVQSGKYITELLEVLPLRAEIIKQFNSASSYTIEVEVACTRYNANPTITVTGGKSGVLLEQFSNN